MDLAVYLTMPEIPVGAAGRKLNLPFSGKRVALKTPAPQAVPCAHESVRQLDEKIQRQTDHDQHEKQGQFQDIKCKRRSHGRTQVADNSSDTSVMALNPDML
ncbi:MAG: hypothetical protein WAL90_16490 [Desulfobacterales bacterium]